MLCRFACLFRLHLLTATVGSLLGAGLVCPVRRCPAAEQASPQQIEFFEKRIRPILVKHCYECHAAEADDVGGGLRLDSRAAMLQGGDTGPALAPGEPNGSLLIAALEYREGLEMPPEGKLPAEVIADFRRWIAQGAANPQIEKKPEQTAETESPERAAAQKHWSLQPMARPRPPRVENSAWPEGDIDRFLLARLEQQSLVPVADAEPHVLLRRVYFDLIGLPPSPQEIAAFQADHSPTAYRELVDRLLASPQFAERWARHWLDMARFAESNGRDRDVLMPYAWRYRNYVIDAIDEDLPYDRFLQEQIAGDLLEAESSQERDRLRIATGLLAVGSKSLTGGGLEMDLVDEQIDVVGKAVMGLTVSCARCHDHKFDAIPTADYYALAGIFRSTETLYGGGLKRPKDTAGKTNVLMVLGDKPQQRIEQVKQQQADIGRVNKQLAAARKKLKQLENRNKKSENNNTAVAGAKKRVSELEAELKKLKADRPGPIEFAVGVRESKKIADCRIHIRGERNKLGEAVPRGFLSCVEVAQTPAVGEKESGRLQLAQWLTREDHPLTARVAVNRIWYHLFGRGLVPTLDNFGVGGQRPTHPKLLDYLAGRFIDRRWSRKELIRSIVLSRAYRMSSDFDAQNYAADAENRYFWRMNSRPLEVEALRDAMLAAADRLRMARPQRSPVAEVGDGEVGRGINTKPLDAPFPYRSVYLPILRTRLPQILKIFDFPEPSNPQSQRDATNVPAQSLFLMNSPFVWENAQAMAARIATQRRDATERIVFAFELALSRRPDDDELRQAAELLESLDSGPPTKGEQPQQIDRWAVFCQSLLASGEFRFLE